MRLFTISLPVLLLAALMGLIQSGKVVPNPPPKQTAKRLRQLSVTPPPSGTPVFNSVRVINPGSDSVSDKPYLLSRFFAAGEIPHFAAAVVEGEQVPTQCDVKTRWPDGSLQHAILSFPIKVPARGSSEVAFADTESPLPAEGLDSNAMLSSDYSLGARMDITPDNGAPASIDAREMIRQGKYRYWLKGPVVTQVILEDASEDPSFDVAFNGHKSLHPIFIVTFYAGHPGARVEFVGENAWLDRLQDIKYSISLSVGSEGSTATVYQRQNFTHIPSTRWRKIFWSGPPLPSLHTDHNLPYLVYSRAVPSFDLSLAISQRDIDEDLAAFRKAPYDDLLGACLYQKYMPTTGGRPELGIFSRWEVRYLYSFDLKLADVFSACSEVSGHVPIHYRESRSGKPFALQAQPDTGEAASALGHVVSTDARPYFCSRDWGIQFSSATDRPVLVGPVTRGGWTPDLAHQASFAYLPYLLTGDWYSLEELYFWSAANVANGTPGSCYYCRGETKNQPRASYGILHGQENQRLVGWGLRTLFHTVLLAPDGSPEKAYFSDKMLNNLAAHEGRLNVTDGLLVSDPSRIPVWEFGRNLLEQGAANPLYFWCIRILPAVNANDTIVEPSKTYAVTGPWMTYIVLDSLAIGSELGYPVRPLHHALGRYLVGQLTSPEYNPYLVSVYYGPSNPGKSVPYQSWAEVLSAFKPSYIALNSFKPASGPDFDYGFIALSALSSLTSLEIDGKTGWTAYQWLRDNYPDQATMNSNPKWAIVPREQPVQGSVSAPASWSPRFKALTRPRVRTKQPRGRF